MPTCIHCLCTEDRHLTMGLCPDGSGNRMTGNAGYVFESIQNKLPCRHCPEPREAPEQQADAALNQERNALKRKR